MRNCQLPNVITGNLALAKLDGVIYSISGRTDVGVDAGSDIASVGGTKGVLTIDPGVTIFGSAGLDYIAVQRGSEIRAVGTATQPIIFTSKSDIEGNASNPGEWGGVIILGRSLTNLCPTDAMPATVSDYKNCTGVFEAVAGLNYGGNNPTDNSGELKYVQIRYTGYAVSAGKEINGLTLAGVGSSTAINYVQVYRSSDDGIELFGGTVNLKHLVLLGNDDEQFDTDNNYSGSVQFMIAKQERSNGLVGGDTMFEMSCNKSGGGGVASLCPPATSYTVRTGVYPKISNATLIMDTTTNKEGIKLDTGTGLLLWNSVVAPVSTTTNNKACLLVQDSHTITSLTNIGANAFNSTFFACAASYAVGKNGSFAAPTTAEVEARFTAGANNTALGTSTLNGFVNGTNEAAVVAKDPTTLNSLANNNVGFFTSVNYIGAVKDSSDTWYAGWTCGLTAGSSC